MIDGRLDTSEAYELLHAAASAIAAEAGAKAVILKGLPSQAYGLVSPRVGADVDLLVDELHWDEVLEELRRCGWSERPAVSVGATLPEHSVTLWHPDWPCDIDVHRYFPGILLPASDAFDVLWSRSVAMDIAGSHCVVPDRMSAILITLLHAMHSPHQSRRHAREARRVLEMVASEFSTIERHMLLQLARDLRVVDTLRPALTTLGMLLPAPAPYGHDQALDDWRMRAAASGTPTIFWATHVRALPRRQRLARIARAVWPPASELGSTFIDPRLRSRSTVLRARLRRLGRGLRAAPSAARGFLAARRGETVSDAEFDAWLKQ